jgi:hypothetical protein
MTAALEEIVPGQIWCAAYPVRYSGARFEARLTVVRLRDGGLLLHSPGPIDDALAARLAELGPVRAIVAPGDLHHLHVAACQRRYPDALTFVCPGVEKKQPTLRFDALLGDEAPALWAGELDQVFVPGARVIHEVAFFHRASQTLILVDLLENFTDRTPNVSWVLQLWFRPLRMWNTPAPAPEYWLLGFRDRAAACASLERILAWDFVRVVIAHGDLITKDARAVVERAWRRVLRR